LALQQRPRELDGWIDRPLAKLPDVLVEEADPVAQSQSGSVEAVLERTPVIRKEATHVWPVALAILLAAGFNIAWSFILYVAIYEGALEALALVGFGLIAVLLGIFVGYRVGVKEREYMAYYRSDRGD
jgi:hypothetical protein